MKTLPVMAVFLCLFTCPVMAKATDSDGDGLSDFQETNKYLTDLQKADSDGDGIPDSDWHERREYTYTVRTVLKVMRPCNTRVVNDDYQDARILAENDNYVELEVIHYPFNTNREGIKDNPTWKNPPPQVQRYLKQGITANWDDTMSRDILSEFQNDGIAVDQLTDKEVVEKVASWLLSRGEYRYMFGTYFVHFPGGTAEILPGLEEAFRREKGNTDLAFDEHVQHEIYGKGMFYNKSYGTCTSTAIYLTTGLRAVGIPTRMVLAVPVVDPTDPNQIRLVRDHVSHHRVRHTLLSALAKLSGFVAHTFNEVYVGGRWCRLNYKTLGQNTYGNGAMSMLTHVHTFTDLSEAGLTRTWGFRYGKGLRDAVFRHDNPYRTTEVSDRFGIYCKIENPIVEPRRLVTIAKAYWFFSNDRPDWISEELVTRNQDGHILLHVDASSDELKLIYPKLAKQFVLSAKGRPHVKAKAERGYWNSECYVRIAEDQFTKMKPGIQYTVIPVEQNPDYRWEVDKAVHITRPSGVRAKPRG
jgi:hypothetical protein